MAGSYDNNSMVYFAADYPTDLGCSLPAAAAAIFKRFNPDDVKLAPGLNYLFQWFGKKKLFLTTHTRISAQTLGLGTWKQEVNDFMSMSEVAFDIIKVSDLKRVGLKLVAYVPQSMSHAELSDLFFGSFLEPVEEWNSIFEKPGDPLIQVNGEREGMKLTTVATAMNPEQIVASILLTQNFDQYSKPRQPESSVLEFVAHASNSPCVMVDVDVFKENVPVAELSEVVKNATAAAERVVGNFMAKFLAKDKLDGN